MPGNNPLVPNPDTSESVAHDITGEALREAFRRGVAAAQAAPPTFRQVLEAGAPLVAAIQFALEADEGMTFLRLWNEGAWDEIRRDWPEAPASVYVTEMPKPSALEMDAAGQAPAGGAAGPVPVPVPHDEALRAASEDAERTIMEHVQSFASHWALSNSPARPPDWQAESDAQVESIRQMVRSLVVLASGNPAALAADKRRIIEVCRAVGARWEPPFHPDFEGGYFLMPADIQKIVQQLLGDGRKESTPRVVEPPRIGSSRPTSSAKRDAPVSGTPQRRSRG